MAGRRNLIIAPEGVPFLVGVAVACGFALQFLNIAVAAVAATLFVVLIFVFRDPRRAVPTSPLGVVSPVDGRIIGIDQVDKGVLQGEARRVHIRINSFGTYTARAPVEGQIKDLRAEAAHSIGDYQINAMWIRTDEGDDLVLQFHGYRLGLAPKSFIGFGQRVGQGQRCANLRLTRIAELHLPIETKMLVEPGETVIAGTDLIGKLIHR